MTPCNAHDIYILLIILCCLCKTLTKNTSINIIYIIPRMIGLGVSCPIMSYMPNSVIEFAVSSSLSITVSGMLTPQLLCHCHHIYPLYYRGISHILSIINAVLRFSAELGCH